LSDGPPGSSSGTDASQAATFAANRKAVMVIYGHDTQAKDVLFDWLRAIGLQPREWNQLVIGSGAASPYIGQVLDHAFQQAQAVVALFTPDERVLSAAASPDDPRACDLSGCWCQSRRAPSGQITVTGRWWSRAKATTSAVPP